MFGESHCSAGVLVMFMLAVMLGVPLSGSAQPSGNAGQNTEEIPIYDPDELRRLIVYPERARRSEIEGTVIVNLLVDKEGKVAKTKIFQGKHPLLDTAAVEALRTMRFTPAKENGKPVAVWVQIPVVFSLSPADRKKSVEHILGPDEVVYVDKEPTYSVAELSRNIIYPEVARSRNVEGQVIVRALISTTGKVLRTMPDKCEDLFLCRAAREAVVATKFQPAMRGGTPVDYWLRIPVVFKLK